MKQVTLNIKEIQFNEKNEAFVITEMSDNNPSKTGVFKQSAKQIARLATRAGAPNVHALKLLVSLGGAKFDMDIESCKKGEAYTDANGEEQTYSRDWEKQSNETMVLGEKAVNKLLEISMTQAFVTPSDDMPF